MHNLRYAMFAWNANEFKWLELLNMVGGPARSYSSMIVWSNCHKQLVDDIHRKLVSSQTIFTLRLALDVIRWGNFNSITCLMTGDNAIRFSFKTEKKLVWKFWKLWEVYTQIEFTRKLLKAVLAVLTQEPSIEWCWIMLSTLRLIAILWWCLRHFVQPPYTNAKQGFRVDRFLKNFTLDSQLDAMMQVLTIIWQTIEGHTWLF